MNKPQTKTKKPRFKAPEAFYNIIRRVGKGEQMIKVNPTEFMLVRAFHRRYPQYNKILFLKAKPSETKLQIDYLMNKKFSNRKFSVFC